MFNVWGQRTRVHFMAGPVLCSWPPSEASTKIQGRRPGALAGPKAPPNGPAEGATSRRHALVDGDEMGGPRRQRARLEPALDARQPRQEAARGEVRDEREVPHRAQPQPADVPEPARIEVVLGAFLDPLGDRIDVREVEPE